MVKATFYVVRNAVVLVQCVTPPWLTPTSSHAQFPLQGLLFLLLDVFVTDVFPLFLSREISIDQRKHSN